MSQTISEENGIRVSLIVADGRGDEEVNNQIIYDVGKSGNRGKRILFVPIKILRKAIKIKTHIYHIHDPELLFVGILLRLVNKKVIFDSHEDIPLQIFSKDYIRPKLKVLLSHLVEIIQYLCFPYFNALIGATEEITEKLKKTNSKSIVINNYPILSELDPVLSEDKYPINKTKNIIYIGSITKNRGIFELVDSLEYSRHNVNLILCGTFADINHFSSIQGRKGWSKVRFMGEQPRHQLGKFLKQSFAGIVTFHALPNHINAKPNKLFEYMSAGIPVIASDFNLWKTIILKNDCGIVVDPTNPISIANGYDYLLDNYSLITEMGKNGKAIVSSHYNWDMEKNKLIQLYKSI